MITVYKYVLPTMPGPFSIPELPQDADLLTVQVQCGLPYVYARVNTDDLGTGTHQLVACETGKSCPCAGQHIGTAMLLNGGYVLHYFVTGVE